VGYNDNDEIERRNKQAADWALFCSDSWYPTPGTAQDELLVYKAALRLAVDTILGRGVTLPSWSARDAYGWRNFLISRIRMAIGREWEYATQQIVPERERELGGKLVREAWVEWASRQDITKPSWLVPWEELSERDKEADRCIYTALRRHFERTLTHDSTEPGSENSSDNDH